MNDIKHVGLLLAAGAGTRFGGAYPGAKLDYSIDGVAVGVRSFDALATVCGAMIVVVRDQKSQLAHYAEARGAQVQVNHSPSRGLGSSLAIGAKFAIDNFPDRLFLWAHLADMPFLKHETLLALAQISTAEELGCQKRILRPRFITSRNPDRSVSASNRGGHPVVFGRAHWEALAELEGDVGAQALIASNRAWLTEMETEDTGVWRDVDSIADVATL